VFSIRSGSAGSECRAMSKRPEWYPCAQNSGINSSCSSLARYGSSFPMTMCWCASIVFDLSWLRHEVADVYCLDDGRPGIDPEILRPVK
jgi:hypothetical protein